MYPGGQLALEELEVDQLRTVDGGRWAVDGGRWTVDGGRWTVDGGRWALDGGRWTVPNKAMSKNVE